MRPSERTARGVAPIFTFTLIPERFMYYRKAGGNAEELVTKIKQAGTLSDALTAIERDNASLKGVLPKDYARPGLDKARLGQLINLVSDIALGSPADRAKDTLGRVYFAKGDLDNAIKSQSKAAELEPHSGLIHRQKSPLRVMHIAEILVVATQDGGSN